MRFRTDKGLLLRIVAASVASGRDRRRVGFYKLITSRLIIPRLTIRKAFLQSVVSTIQSIFSDLLLSLLLGHSNIDPCIRFELSLLHKESLQLVTLYLEFNVGEDGEDGDHGDGKHADDPADDLARNLNLTERNERLHRRQAGTWQGHCCRDSHGHWQGW